AVVGEEALAYGEGGEGGGDAGFFFGLFFNAVVELALDDFFSDFQSGDAAYAANGGADGNADGTEEEANEQADDAADEEGEEVADEAGIGIELGKLNVEAEQAVLGGGCEVENGGDVGVGPDVDEDAGADRDFHEAVAGGDGHAAIFADGAIAVLDRVFD